METKEKKNKLQHVFSFEDLYKEEEESDSQDNNNQYELPQMEQKETKKNFFKSSTKTDDYDYEKKLSKNSKYELMTRIILFSIAIIFIPFSIMVKNNFDKIENHLIFEKIKDLVSRDILLENSPKSIFYIYQILQNKDFMLGFACVLYVIVHPYISLKLIICSAFFYYLITLFKCINQTRRPLWEVINNNEVNDIIKCETSYSSPSDEIFFITFYFLYPIFCIKRFYSNYTRMNILIKIIFLIIYLALIVFEYFYLLLYKLNYLYEIIFTNMLTLIFICILIDFDKKLQKKLSDSTKNIFKTRKNKLKIFIYCFILFFIAILLFNFIIPSKILLEVIEKLSKNESCSEELTENLGMDKTFINISFVFSMIGAFWGACLNIEYNPGEWWYQPLIINKDEISKIHSDISFNKIGCAEIVLLILKCIIMIIVYISLLFGFYQIPYITFEFKLMIEGVKYFIMPFICLGIIPLLFGLLHMNKKVGDIYDNIDELNTEAEDWSKNLFGATLFVHYQEKARYPYIHLKRN